MAGSKDNVLAVLRNDPLLAILSLEGDQEPCTTMAIRQAAEPGIVGALLEASFDPDASGPLNGLTSLEVVAGLAPDGPAAGLPDLVPGGFCPDLSGGAGECGALGDCAWGDAQAGMMFAERAPAGGTVRLGGSMRTYQAEQMSEDRRVQYASWLLAFGARRRGRAARAAREAGLLRLARVIEHWSGEECASLVLLRRAPKGCCCARSPGAAPSSPHRCCLLCAPGEVADRIQGFLAPAPEGSRWPADALRPSS